MPTTGRQVGSKGTLLPNAPGSTFASRKGAYILVDGTKYHWSGSAWVDESGKEAKRVGEPSVVEGRQVVIPPSQVKLASSKIALIQSLLRICEGNKEFSMTKSGDSDLILEEKVAAPKFLGLSLGSPKKGYSARISLDEGKKEVKYHEMSSLFTKTLGKAQDNPLVDRMRGSIRQVVESAGWRFYTS